MAVLRRNLIANFTGAAWTALLSFAVVPVYIKLLGVEAYALIGLQLTMQAMLFTLDLGLSTTVNREIARLHHDPANAREIRELVLTLEVLYWLIALAVAVGIALLAAPIADRWVHTVTLSRATVVTTMRLIGVVIALQFPFAFYSGGLLGLQRHVAMNAVTICFATLRAAGAIAVLLLVSRSIDVFFGWTGAHRSDRDVDHAAVGKGAAFPPARASPHRALRHRHGRGDGNGDGFVADGQDRPEPRPHAGSIRLLHGSHHGGVRAAARRRADVHQHPAAIRAADCHARRNRAAHRVSPERAGAFGDHHSSCGHACLLRAGAPAGVDW
jgi:hypothetical protein